MPFSDSTEIDLLGLKLHQDLDRLPERPSSPAACCCPSHSPQTFFREDYSCRFCPQVDDYGHAGCDGVTYPDMLTLVSTHVNQCQPQCFSINTVIQADRRSISTSTTKWLEENTFLLLREEENHMRG